MKLVAATLGALIAVAACAPAASRQPSADFESPAPTFESAASATPTASAPAASLLTTPGAEPTQFPQPTFFGEFPGPKATVPPHQGVITGLSLHDLADLWASLGLSCESNAIGGPESAAAYTVHCEGGDPAADVSVVAGAAYWTLDGVGTFQVDVGSFTLGGSIDGAAASRWLLPFARLAGGEAVVSWVEDHMADPACRSGCTMVVRDSKLIYDVGSHGYQGLELVAPVPA